MRISIKGSDSTALCQIGALRDAFAALGHEHIDDPSHPDVAFVFVGNPDYSPYLDLIGKKKVIFNVLDCPIWVPEWPMLRTKWTEQLKMADHVTCISETVKKQLKEYCNIDASVIYYPMKPVRHTGNKVYPFKVAMLGRLRDPEKFVSAAIQALIHAGFNENDVVMVGPEYPGWGVNGGILTDAQINDVLNSVDYVVMLDRGCGIGLPAIEAACCGAIPIVAPHCMTFDEFWVESPLGLHYQRLSSIESVSSLIRSIESDVDWKKSLKNDFAQYGKQVFRPKFEAVEVVKRIVNVFHTL